MVTSIINIAGSEAEEIVKLWWILFVISTIVFVAVLFFLIVGHFRTQKDPKKLQRSLILATGITTFFLLIIVVATFNYSQPFKEEKKGPVYTIDVIGKQWWWQVRYPNFTTANELHVPVGVPIKFRLHSDNVIHSFWVPALGGKMDMIPGQVNELIIKANKPGIYHGICAEFCGIQHALMAFKVIATTEQKFQVWSTAQAQKAVAPQTQLAEQGKKVFIKANCIKCHNVRGLSELSENAPDLTHLASRTTLAAATLPNRKGHLAGWIMDPQSIKPGNLMPSSNLSGEELQALLHYLEALK